MYKGNIFPYIAVFAATFIAVGDRFLPHPYAQMSSNSRAQIEQWAVNLFPDVRVSSNSSQIWEDRERQYTNN